MIFDQTFLLHLVEAVALGLGAAVILRLLRRYAAIRRVQFSVFASAVMLGLYLILNGSQLPGEDTLIKIVVVIGVLFAANALLQIFTIVVFERLLGQQRHRSVPRLLVELFDFVVLTLVALALLNRVFDVELSAFLVTSTVVSAVIGLSLQDILGNVIAGLALQVEQPFRVGDWVRLDDAEGQVTQMNWRTLTLLTRDHHHVIMPNANVARQDVINFSRPIALQRIHLSIGVAYQHPPEEVKAVLLQAVAGVEGVRTSPAPEAVVTGYGDFAIGYDMRVWINDYAHVEQIRDAIMSRLWYTLRRAGMSIPFPIRDVNLRTIGEDHAAQADARLRRDVFNVLRPLPLFEPLDDSQIDQLAQNAVLQRYMRGEHLVRQGESGSSLFVIKSGQVKVDARGDAGRFTTVNVLGPGDFFGELSLLTGEPRGASVSATMDTEVVVVEKAAFAPVFAADVGIAEALSDALEDRQRVTAEQLALGAQNRSEKISVQRKAMGDRIRSFFGMS